MAEEAIGLNSELDDFSKDIDKAYLKARVIVELTIYI